MNSFSKAFLPKFLKEVMTHIPTIALKSMDWKGVLKELGPMAARLGKKDLDDEGIESLKNLGLPEISVVKGPVSNNYRLLNVDQKKAVGETVLYLFFAQLKNQDGISLDLRPKHFQREDGQVCFAPNNVWFSFKKEFRLALIDLYKGFYHNNDEVFEGALERAGLAKGLNKEETLELERLFKVHFGPGEEKEISFDLNQFKESFYQMFKFFVDHKVSLDKDFMFLGIYLVGLYMNLQELGVSLDVNKSFLKVFPNE